MNKSKPTTQPDRKYEIAIITWVDAAMHGDGTFWSEDIKNLKLMDGVAVGIIVAEDKESITLAMDWFYNVGSFRQLHTYPKSGITNLVKKYIAPSK